MAVCVVAALALETVGQGVATDEGGCEGNVLAIGREKVVGDILDEYSLALFSR